MSTDSHLAHDEWLSQRLGCDAYRLIADSVSGEDPGAKIERAMGGLRGRRAFIYAKVEPRDTAVIRALELAGFSLIDTNVVLEKPARAARIIPVSSNAEWAAPADRDETVRLASRAFECSRFHLDARIGKAVADRIKGDWVDSYFAGRRGSRMVIARSQRAVAGFLLLVDGPGEWTTIDLIAVDPALRRRGHARDMMAFAEDHYGESRAWRVGTQLANIAALRFYESVDYRVSGAYYVFHCHLA